MAFYQAIKSIQTQLQLDGYYKGILDGIHGNATQEAIRKAIDSGNYKLGFNFEVFKKEFNKPRLTQPFVDSLNTLFKNFNEFNNQDGTNPLYVAYMLGTAWLETAYTMQPIKEYGSYKYLSRYDVGRLARILGNTPQADGDGQLYAGRGYVMITGKANYRKFSLLLDLDLLKYPDLALDRDTSAKILILGSLRGSFTNKKLSDFIRHGHRLEFISARRVINGNDRASDIADYAQKFLNCLILEKVQAI